MTTTAKLARTNVCGPEESDTTSWLLTVLGPNATAAVSRDLTAQELADVEAGLARHHGDAAAALGVNVDADTAAYLQYLVGGSR